MLFIHLAFLLCYLCSDILFKNSLFYTRLLFCPCAFSTYLSVEFSIVILTYFFFVCIVWPSPSYLLILPSDFSTLWCLVFSSQYNHFSFFLHEYIRFLPQILISHSGFVFCSSSLGGYHFSSEISFGLAWISSVMLPVGIFVNNQFTFLVSMVTFF